MSKLKAKDSPYEGTLTQQQIADQLGVSRQLVGFALRGQGRMSDQTRQQILEAVKQGGYTQYSNREARTLASRRYGRRAATGVLAILFRSTFDNQPLPKVPFFAPFFEGLEVETTARGVDFALCPLRPHELPRLVRDGQIDGVICLLTPHETTVEIKGLQIPIISVQYEVPHVPSLVIDEEGGTALATQHLIELGRREIAYLGVARPLQKLAENKRYQGYLKALQSNGIPVNPRITNAALEEPTFQDGADGMRAMLERNSGASRQDRLPFSGLVCYNDNIAMGAIRTLQAHGYNVPDDVSVTGFDDVSGDYGFSPAVTSVCFPRYQMARRAVQLLCQSQQDLEQGLSAEWREMFPVELVARDSTRPLTISQGS